MGRRKVTSKLCFGHVAGGLSRAPLRCFSPKGTCHGHLLHNRRFGCPSCIPFGTDDPISPTVRHALSLRLVYLYPKEFGSRCFVHFLWIGMEMEYSTLLCLVLPCLFVFHVVRNLQGVIFFFWQKHSANSDRTLWGAVDPSFLQRRMQWRPNTPWHHCFCLLSHGLESRVCSGLALRICEDVGCVGGVCFCVDVCTFLL